MTSEELKVIISAEIGKLQDALQQGQKDLQKFEKQGKQTGSNFGKAMGAAGKAVGTAMKAVGAAILAAGAAVVGLAESTREYRTEQAKLTAAFETAGASAETAKQTYNDLYRVLGDSGQSVEAANHLAQLTNNEKDLAEWTRICQGAYATFGDSLPIESLTEAANETAKTGEITGALADALNWAGVSEDELADKLFWANSESEREAIIRDTLTEIYGEAADAYEVTAASILSANEAQAMLTNATAELGAAVEPVTTIFKAGLANALSGIVPHLSEVAQGFTDVINGVEGGSERLSAGISNLMNSVVGTIADALPTILSLGVEILTALIVGINNAIPKVLQTLADLIPQVITILGTLIPQVTGTILNSLPLIIETILQAVAQILVTLGEIIPVILAQIVSILPQIIQSIVDNIPVLLQAAITFLMAIVEAIPQIIPPLIESLPSIIQTILSMLTENIPVLLEAAISLFWAIIDALPSIVTALVDALPQIIDSILTFLIDNFPVLILGAVDLFMALVEAIPIVVGELIKAIPQIIAAIVVNLINKGPEIFGALWDTIVGIFERIPDFFKNIFSGAVNLIKSAWSGIGNFFGTLWDGIKNGAKGVINGIITIFEYGINGIIGFINTITGGLSKVWDWTGLPSIPKIPKVSIPRLEMGGIIDKATLAMIGENGKEAVVPLENNTEWLDMLANRLAGMLNTERPIYLNVDGKVFAKTAISTMNDLTKQTGRLELVLA